MTRYSFLLFLLIITSSVFAQTSKFYIDKDGKHTNKSKHAIYYVLSQKLADTVYSLQQFDMRNELMLQEYYKDSLLTIRNGKYVDYVNPAPNALVLYPADTGRYVETAGYYANGVQTGIWVSYLYRNIKDYTCTFVKGKLNGLYIQYMTNRGFNSFNHVEFEGMLVDDKKEGEWINYDTLKNVEISRVFLHDTLKSVVYHTRGILPPANFSAIVSKSLETIIKKYSDTGLSVIFPVNTDGTTGDISFDQEIPADDAKLIKDAIAVAGNFQPAIHNDKPYKDTYTLHINRYLNINNLSGPNALDEYSRHTDLIGRGLNNMGIGKPVDH